MLRLREIAHPSLSPLIKGRPIRDVDLVENDAPGRRRDEAARHAEAVVFRADWDEHADDFAGLT